MKVDSLSASAGEAVRASARHSMRLFLPPPDFGAYRTARRGTRELPPHIFPHCKVLYAAVLCAPSPRVFRANGAENLNSRRATFISYITLCGYYSIDWRRMQIFLQKRLDKRRKKVYPYCAISNSTVYTVRRTRRGKGTAMLEIRNLIKIYRPKKGVPVKGA